MNIITKNTVYVLSYKNERDYYTGLKKYNEVAWIKKETNIEKKTKCIDITKKKN